MIVATHPTHERDSFMAEMYCFCTDASSRLQILSDIAPQINAQFSTEMISYLEIDTQTLYLGGRSVRVTEQARIEDHALRCLEGVDKSSMDEAGLRIQGLTIDPDLDETTPIAQLLWTGAVERGGRLKGVLTIYGEHRALSAIEKQLLRRLRTLIADGFDRLSQRASVTRSTPHQTGIDVFALTIDTPVERGDITGLVMTKLQDAVAQRLAEHIPDAFMVAKLGLNRLMVVGNPNRPMPLSHWEVACAEALRSLSETSGIRIDFSIEKGDLDRINESPICGLVSKPAPLTQFQSRAVG